MQELLASRIALTPRPLQPRNAALEVAMLGHCPGRVRVPRLLAFSVALAEMRSVGFGAAIDQLLAGTGDASLNALYHLPIPLRSSAEFHDIFPDASAIDSEYVSVLAGRRAWLAQSVDDFFANGGEKLWVMSIPQAHGQAGFLPAENTALHDVRTLQGIASVAVIPSIGSIALPDLERLQIPAQLPDIPRVRLDNPDPQFLPCGTNTDDDHRERRYSSELITMADPQPLNQILRGILQFIGKHRPDIQCLFTLPLSYSGELDSPALDPQSLHWITQIRDADSGHLLRHMQFLFPYLRGPRFALQSPVGLISGKQSAMAQQHGPWRSIAAQPLISEARPYPRLSIAQTVQLRNNPGLSVLANGHHHVQLDDERIVVPALHPQDYANADDLSRYDGYRSAEIMRLLGYLRRQLNALGDQLIFNLDYRDPRPRLLLERFFRHLQHRGALRGATAEEAFRIEEINTQEGAMIFEILIAPAFPIDRIQLTFTNQHGEWQTLMPDALQGASRHV